MAKFLTLTDKCNCFCTFCYEISPTGEPHVFVAELAALKEEMRQAMHVEGWNDIVITGGEPTITKTFLPVVSHAREMGFEMRAVATNGRRFSYEPFTREATRLGLTKAWVSLFGHDARTHDACTRTPDSFVETTRGIRNLLGAGAEVTCSVVVNKLNHKLLKEYFDTVHELGVRSVSMMGLKPFGGAFLNQKAVFYDLKEGAPFVNEAIRYGLDRGFEIKSMGLPGTFFDTRGTRDDNNRALKYFDYVLKMQGGEPYCEGPLCETCFGRAVCPTGAREGEWLACKCNGISEKVVREAIAGGATSVEALGAETRAGTGCGTCSVDLEGLIQSEQNGTAFEPSRTFTPSKGRHGASLSTKVEWKTKRRGVKSAPEQSL